MSKKKHKLVNDPRRPQLFSNEELGLPDADYEYKEVVTTDSQGRKVRQRIPVRTKDSFVRAAREIWGDQNDYSESVLTGMKEPITIRCRKHDHYYTVPMAQNHIIKRHGNVRPTGCPLCEAERIGYYPNNRGSHHFRTPEERERDEQEKARRRAEREAKREQRKAENLEEVRRERQQRERDEQALIARWHAASLAEARFIERVHEKYPDLDTALVVYGGPDKEVALICPLHGLFEIKPRTLLNGTKDHPPSRLLAV